MEYKDTDPDIQTFLINRLISWIQDPHGHEIQITSFPPQKQRAFQNQLKLGWYAFITGLIHPTIIQLQQQHYSTKHRKTTGASWATQIIQQNWQTLYDLWLLRNHTLHQRTIDDNHGLANLDYAITVEYHLGPLGQWLLLKAPRNTSLQRHRIKREMVQTHQTSKRNQRNYN